jgi:hypothetical protein
LDPQNSFVGSEVLHGPAKRIDGSGKGSGHMKLFEPKKKIANPEMLICLEKLLADLDIRVIS